MVRLLLFALIAAAGWYAWKVLKRHQARVDAALRKAEAKVSPTVREQKSIALEKDPKTGVYRPTDRLD